MPIYEYQCHACGKACELLQKASEAPTTTCPSCGKDQLQRKISAPSFQLKGTGWYVTDFKEKKSEAKEKPDTSTEASKTDKKEG
jgi:putative FmdB family regulatory protein